MSRNPAAGKAKKKTQAEHDSQAPKKLGSSVLYRCLDLSSDSGEVHKQVVWADEYIEIICNQPKTERHRNFYIPCGVASALIQRYSTELSILWELVAKTVRYYDDRVLFSTDYLISCPVILDSTNRPAYRIYEVGNPRNPSHAA